MRFGGASLTVRRHNPQHFLNFFPLPHGHGSFRPTLGLPAIAGEEVPRSSAVTFDSSPRGSPSPPKLIFVVWRKTVPTLLTLCAVSIAAALRLACRRNSLASST